jgi:hypothetical protein
MYHDGRTIRESCRNAKNGNHVLGKVVQQILKVNNHVVHIQILAVIKHVVYMIMKIVRLIGISLLILFVQKRFVCGFADRSCRNDKLSRFPENSTVQCYYDPKTNKVDFSEPSEGKWIGGCVGSSFGLLCFFSVLVYISKPYFDECGLYFVLDVIG